MAMPGDKEPFGIGLCRGGIHSKDPLLIFSVEA